VIVFSSLEAYLRHLERVADRERLVHGIAVGLVLVAIAWLLVLVVVLSAGHA